MICRQCGRGEVNPVFDLGMMPLVNVNPSAFGSEDPPRYPLELGVCGMCSLAQLTSDVPPSRMFDSYAYFSSVSTPMVEYAAKLCDDVAERRGLNRNSLVIEIGSNDGYLLRNYAARGVPVLGIEPAANVALEANRRGVRTKCCYFNRDAAASLASEGMMADVIHAHNVLAHCPDINGFLAGVKALLKPGGLVIIEVPNALRMSERGEFDTIYHEHVFYFTPHVLCRVLRESGLCIRSAAEVEIHGGSLHIEASNAGNPDGTIVLVPADHSREMALHRSLKRKAESTRSMLLDLLRELSGSKIAAFGAAAKGAVLLNYCGIGNDKISYCVDETPAKQGRSIPGTGIPIVPMSRLNSDPPDYILILPWNFKDAITGKLSGRGYKFILPIPAVRIVV